ncbi:MAG: prolipoprotein diacylglyceryl transferase [Myxococcota bacterium]
MYPELFRIGDFSVSTFGVMMAIAFLVGGELAARSFERAGERREIAWQLVTWCAIGGILGAKLWYVVEQAARNSGVPWTEFLLSRSGLTWYGGFAGGTIAGLLGGRHYGVRLSRLVDLAAPTLAAGQAIGRIGCLLVGDDYGRPSDLPWAISFPNGLPPTIDEAGHVFSVHPTMVYETLWLGAATLWLWRRRGRSPFLFGEYLFLAGTGRLWIELLRTNPPALGPLTNAQLVASLCLAIGLAEWLRRRVQRPGVSPGAAA